MRQAILWGMLGIVLMCVGGALIANQHHLYIESTLAIIGTALTVFAGFWFLEGEKRLCRLFLTLGGLVVISSLALVGIHHKWFVGTALGTLGALLIFLALLRVLDKSLKEGAP
ncbi:hypothetical protein J7J24_00265 [bacterium]|nr:hypothetical protein [bacterium]